MDATFVVFQLVMASIVHGALLIRGPNQNIMEGDSVTLECLYSDNAFNISRVRFESFSELLKMWRPVWPTSWCFYDLNVEQVDDKMVLHVPHVAHFAEGFFRCVSDDHTLSAPNNASKTLSFKVHYLGEVHLSREGFSNFIGLPQELRVQRGDDVVLKCSASSSEEPDYCWYKEGDDWILPSSVITLKKVSDMDSGVYTCTVEHPTALLEKMRNISLVVLPGNVSNGMLGLLRYAGEAQGIVDLTPHTLRLRSAENANWFETHSGHLVLMTFGLPVLAAVLSACIYHRKKSAKRKPIDDRSQTKPIYKDSTEALHSNSRDKQPLVAV
ncbi:uncharacterized protein si:ch211-79k12.1 isoform X1 [Phyllopteryx taeniolatus]|uniref:uncharacterized protein si:ch211-79k12.1 isoform X1 n=1 Tax=Phyllopteryx taeniolatus TaxID=161469 RepID=UPI002AD5267B|nr:uncharacterized protein si:ch211-79k12.1 isoform X1 [Phyllopteryx taeniolatus]